MSSSRNAVWIAAAVAWSALVASALVVISWKDQLPDPIAVHWGVGGQANGFASAADSAWLMAAIIGGSVLLLAAVGMAAGRSATGKRLIVGTILYLGFMGALLSVLTAGFQRGMESAATGKLPAWVLAISLLAPVLPAVLGAVLVRRVPVPDAEIRPAPDAPRVALIDGHIPEWRGHTTARPVSAVIAVGLLVAIFGWIGLAMHSWLMVALGIVLGALVSVGLAFTVTADQHGLVVRSWAGWPRKRIPARKIEGAEAVTVEPLQEFGGWGYRIGIGGAEGIVVRKGPGIRVRYGDGLVLVVTLNRGAELAAATLNTAAMLAFDRRH